MEDQPAGLFPITRGDAIPCRPWWDTTSPWPGHPVACCLVEAADPAVALHRRRLACRAPPDPGSGILAALWRAANLAVVHHLAALACDPSHNVLSRWDLEVAPVGQLGEECHQRRSRHVVDQAGEACHQRRRRPTQALRAPAPRHHRPAEGPEGYRVEARGANRSPSRGARSRST